MPKPLLHPIFETPSPYHVILEKCPHPGNHGSNPPIPFCRLVARLFPIMEQIWQRYHPTSLHKRQTTRLKAEPSDGQTGSPSPKANTRYTHNTFQLYTIRTHDHLRLVLKVFIIRGPNVLWRLNSVSNDFFRRVAEDSRSSRLQTLSVTFLPVCLSFSVFLSVSFSVSQSLSLFLSLSLTLQSLGNQLINPSPRISYTNRK